MAEVGFSELTTLRLGGPAGRLVTVEDEPAYVEAARDPESLLLGGGSNLVVADEGFSGTVVRIATSGVQVDADACSGATVTVAAGEPWDAVVALAVTEGWVGVEAMAGIPGLVGATPIQNVGAYGQEVADSIARVRCLDRTDGTVHTFAAADCGFGYRTSRFKEHPGRYAVLDVTFQLALGNLGAPVRYVELARTLDVEPGERAPLVEVREAVLGLRGAKGMVLETDDHDTWSAGSFFTNPFVAHAPEGAPAYPQPDGRVKTSAAWLIEQAGFPKGYGDEHVALSSKHTLALTNRGSGTTAGLLALAAEIQRGVHERFGVWLVNEPVLVGCALPDRAP